MKFYGFRDLIMRDKHHSTSTQYEYEVTIRGDLFETIPWERLSRLDQKEALRCASMVGGIVEAFPVKVIVYYERVASDFTGELPPKLPPKIMDVVR